MSSATQVGSRHPRSPRHRHPPVLPEANLTVQRAVRRSSGALADALKLRRSRRVGSRMWRPRPRRYCKVWQQQTPILRWPAACSMVRRQAVRRSRRRRAVVWHLEDRSLSRGSTRARSDVLILGRTTVGPIGESGRRRLSVPLPVQARCSTACHQGMFAPRRTSPDQLSRTWRTARPLSKSKRSAMSLQTADPRAGNRTLPRQRRVPQQYVAQSHQLRRSTDARWFR